MFREHSEENLIEMLKNIFIHIFSGIVFLFSFIFLLKYSLCNDQVCEKMRRKEG